MAVSTPTKLDEDPFRRRLLLSTLVATLAFAALFLAVPDIDKFLVNLLRGDDGLIEEAPYSIAKLRVNIRILAVGAICVAGIFWLTSLAMRKKLLWFYPAEWFYVVLCGLIGPLLLVEGILKRVIGRPRPRMVGEFSEGLIYGKQLEFVGALRSGGLCPTNCSFVSGEVAVAVTVFASYLFLCKNNRLLIAILLVAAWAISGYVRYRLMAHFPSDVLFAGLFMILVAGSLHWLMFTRLDLQKLLVKQQ